MNRRAFTLIELMIVVLIIGILAAIAIPKYTDVTLRARAASIVSDARVIVSAAELFAADNGSFPSGAPEGVVPQELEPYLGEGFDFAKYQDSQVLFSFENDLSEEGGGVSVSVNSTDQEMLNTINEIAPGFLQPASGGLGSSRLSAILATSPASAGGG